jgi:ribonuclease HII
MWLKHEDVEYSDTIYVDESARGCLAFSMICCAVIVNLSKSNDLKDTPPDLRDGKKLSKKQRLKIFKRLKETRIVNFTTVEVTPSQIDDMGMAEAWKFGIRKCIKYLHDAYPPFEKNKDVQRKVLIDGGFCKIGDLKEFQIESVIKGDNKFYGIAAAGIIAKETHEENKVRDVILLNPDEKKKFGEILLKGSGYWYKNEHANLLKQKIYTKFHRKSFDPLRTALGIEATQEKFKRKFIENDEETIPLPLRKRKK